MKSILLLLVLLISQNLFASKNERWMKFSSGYKINYTSIDSLSGDLLYYRSADKSCVASIDSLSIIHRSTESHVFRGIAIGLPAGLLAGFLFGAMLPSDNSSLSFEQAENAGIGALVGAVIGTGIGIGAGAGSSFTVDLTGEEKEMKKRILSNLLSERSL